MKKLLTLLLVAVMAAAVCACGSSDSGSKESEPAAPLDLTGTWAQTDPDPEDMWQEATISDGVIEINWISDGGNTKSLYWAGTYTAPTDSADTYAWTSENDTEKTSSALLASSDETKDFTYENGAISYEAAAMGTTVTIKLEKK